MFVAWLYEMNEGEKKPSGALESEQSRGMKTRDGVRIGRGQKRKTHPEVHAYCTMGWGGGGGGGEGRK